MNECEFHFLYSLAHGCNISSSRDTLYVSSITRVPRTQVYTWYKYTWRSFVSPLVVGQSPSSGQRVKRSFSFSINQLSSFLSLLPSPTPQPRGGLFALFTLFFRSAAPSPYRRPLSFLGSLGSLPRSAHPRPTGSRHPADRTSDCFYTVD